MSAEDQYEDGMGDLVQQVAESCLGSLRKEMAQQQQQQTTAMEQLLKDWSDRLVEQTTAGVREAIAGAVPATASGGGVDEDKEADDPDKAIESIRNDMTDRQTGLIMSIQEAHNRQLEVLRAAIAEERKQFAQSQLIFEQTLKTRYEVMVDSLQEKVKAEQEARMQRALENLERAARVESERAKQSFEIQQEAELTLSKKFKSIVSDLRRSWEEEETGRAMQLEERLRSHYSVVLEHMEAQLKMALKLQDDADKQWLEDVEARNTQQIETLRAFEDKCKRLYDIRLTEYAEKTSQQIAQYEEQLLEAGTVLASEKAQFESRLRRIKLACSRWKVAYQKNLHERYQEMTGVLEERYMSEIAERLQEINDLQAQLSAAQSAVHQKEQEIIKVHKMYAPGVTTDHDGTTSSTSSMRAELTARWDDLKTPASDRVDSLVELLDAAQVTPVVVNRYNSIIEKLSDRQPIAQLINRRQFIEYKLKLASRMGNEGSNSMSQADRASLITELTEISNNIEAMKKQYEKKYGESYNKVSTNGPAAGNFANTSAVPPPPPAFTTNAPSTDSQTEVVADSQPAKQLEHVTESAVPAHEDGSGDTKVSKELPPPSAAANRFAKLQKNLLGGDSKDNEGKTGELKGNKFESAGSTGNETTAKERRSSVAAMRKKFAH